MIKKFLTCVCLVLALVLCVAPVSAAESDNTHFDKPTSVCADGDDVYIADDKGAQSVVYRFTAEGHEVIPLDAAPLKIRCVGGILYIMSQNAVTVYDTAGKTVKTVTATGVKDFDVTQRYIYTLFDDGIRQNDVSSLNAVSDLALENTVVAPADSSASAVAVNGEDIYYIAQGALQAKIGNFYSKFTLNGETKITAGGGQVFAFGGGKLSVAQDNATAQIASFDFNVTDVFVKDGTVYVINADQFQVYTYTYDGASLTQNAVIYGSNVKDYPTSYGAIDSFDKVLVYTAARDTYFYASASDADGWHGYISAGSAVMALATHDDFYYVVYLGGDAPVFGFVEAADFTEVRQQQLSLLKVTVTSNESLYTLPIESAEYKLTDGGQTVAISNTQNITVICYVKGFAQNGWAFVSVGDYTGFIPSDRLKDPPAVYPSYEVKIANPPIGSSLTVYEQQDTQSAVLARIKSGEMLKIFTTEGEWSLVQITVDGQETYGWAQNAYMINEGDMTDTVALGLALGIILLLCVAFAVLWKMRNGKKKK